MNTPDPLPMTPPELRSVESSLDALARRDAAAAPAGFEERIARAAAAASDAPRPVVRRLWFARTAAAAVFGAAVLAAMFVVVRPGGGPAGVDGAIEVAALEAEMDAWLDASTWMVVAMDDGGDRSADDALLEDFWPSLNDPLLWEESL